MSLGVSNPKLSPAQQVNQLGRNIDIEIDELVAKFNKLKKESEELSAKVKVLDEKKEIYDKCVSTLDEHDNVINIFNDYTKIIEDAQKYLDIIESDGNTSQYSTKDDHYYDYKEWEQRKNKLAQLLQSLNSILDMIK